MRISAIVFCLTLVTGAVHGQSTKGRPSASKGSATESAPKFKAIWEPVNYGKDINLQAVHFVSADEGWVVGDKNTILHTANGGKTWEVQLGGDLESTERALSEVFFVDAKHGWARAAEKLFRTRDGGGTWEQVASKSGNWRKLTFVSPRIGFIIHADAIERTEDGGQTWKPIFKCTIDLLVGGLARKSACTFCDLAFPSTQFGYAIGTDNAGAGAGILARTQDGGQTWVATHPASLDREGVKLRFWDDKSGIAMVRGKNLVTRALISSWRHFARISWARVWCRGLVPGNRLHNECRTQLCYAHLSDSNGRACSSFPRRSARLRDRRSRNGVPLPDSPDRLSGARLDTRR